MDDWMSEILNKIAENKDEEEIFNRVKAANERMVEELRNKGDECLRKRDELLRMNDEIYKELERRNNIISS